MEVNKSMSLKVFIKIHESGLALVFSNTIALSFLHVFEVIRAIYVGSCLLGFRGRTITYLWDYVIVQYGEKVLKDMDRMEAFHKALTSWGNWVDSDVDTAKLKYVEDWDHPVVRNCALDKHPVSRSTHRGGPLPVSKVIKEVLSGIKKPVHLLDMTICRSMVKMHFQVPTMASMAWTSRLHTLVSCRNSRHLE
ncbi:protein trichome birefringence-like 37 [Tripterygium wilfordii]|uniref:protein trichome birefringence-like 37 n=1 Tax=Tripterygium wilfordii TaxID=458696 RepID=UPI0018F857F2|nr:protein trichome birefringence-like 37 [Tripterygium wilfordii]